MKIATYYEPIEGSDKVDHEALIHLWIENWKSRDYEPVVLGIADAETHSEFVAMEKQVEALPTVNKIAYEGACYRRWLAFQQLAEDEGKAVLMSDYDVFNYSTHYPFQDTFNPLRNRLGEEQILFFSFLHAGAGCPEGARRMNTSVRPTYRNIFAWIIPCLVYAEESGFQHVIDLILGHTPTNFDFIHDWKVPHTSDQFILTQHAGDPSFIESHQCMEAYFEPGWQRFPISHYPTGRMLLEHKTPRAKYISSCREGL